jgi:hypothetical protein
VEENHADGLDTQWLPAKTAVPGTKSVGFVDTPPELTPTFTATTPNPTSPLHPTTTAKPQAALTPYFVGSKTLVAEEGDYQVVESLFNLIF